MQHESESMINEQTSAWANRQCHCMKACDSTHALSIAEQLWAEAVQSSTAAQQLNHDSPEGERLYSAAMP